MTLKRHPAVEHPATILRGGLDQITPAVILDPGFCIDAVNFECATSGGYSRIKGYERFDGRPFPSGAIYSLIQFASFTTPPTIGQILTGSISTATGTVAFVGTNYVIVTKLSVAQFITTDIITQTGPVTIGTMINQTVAVNAQLRALYKAAAADILRADIQPVGGAAGAGTVLGCFVFNDIYYAFRANAALTAVNLWKSSATGWVQVVFPNDLSIDTTIGTGLGNAIPPPEGSIATGGTSGKTATVRRVPLEIGAWRTAAAATTDAGRIIYTDLAGAATFTSGETITFTGGATAIARTTNSTTMTIGGKFQFSRGNFLSSASTIRIYGCDNVNRPFEFDGTYLVFINIGVAPYLHPKYIIYHLNYLVCAVNASLLYSEVGFPYRFTTGGEIGTGDTINGLQELPGTQDSGSLAVMGPNTTQILYGRSVPFKLSPFNSGVGSIDYTIQNFVDMLLFNENGISVLTTTQQYGNFLLSSLVDNIIPFINNEVTKASNSTVCRAKNQYRVFFNDGFGLFLTMSKGEPLGVMPVYFPDPVYCAFEGRLIDRSEVILFGSNSGYLFQMERGTSFDGKNIDAFIKLAWNSNRSPRVEKTYQHATIEIRSPNYAQVGFSYELGYGTPELTPSTTTQFTADAQSPAFWDSFTWDSFSWDGKALLPSEVDMDGTAENVSVTLASSTNYIDLFTIDSVVYSLINRRAKR